MKSTPNPRRTLPGCATQPRTSAADRVRLPGLLSTGRRLALQRTAQVTAAAALWLALGPAPQPVRAQAAARSDAPGVEIRTLNLRREDGTVLLDFDLLVHLPAVVEDALNRGVPLYFQAQATLFRPRWYWRDARISRVERQWRLSYQPLTGVYRVTLGSISQNHNRLEDALAAVSRLGRWQLADASQAEAGERHYAEFTWRLDTTQLPRPMQFGLTAGGEWSLGVERTLRLEP
ncbi:MAG: DUF4390 domain-containing protein [Burkholderiaceae bacterium]